MATSTRKACAVLVTFNPDTDFLDNVSEVANAVDKIFIVDNASAKDNFIHEHKFSSSNIEFIFNSANMGIATALNIGVRRALDEGFQWVLTLDQDTFISKQSLDQMFVAYDGMPEKETIGILAPVHYDKKTGYQSSFIRGLKGPYTPREIVMTSGNLIPRATFEKVGFYDDDLFIEYVDHDYCLKAKAHGLKVILVKEVQMGHSLGNIRQHRWGPLFFFSHNYAAVRRYYRARNRLILYRRHFGFWILQDQEFAIKDMAKILLVEKYRLDKVKATILGTFDGLLGRLGAFEGATYTTPKASKYFVEMREEILPLLPAHSKRALDLGCGSGETSGYIKKLGKVDWVCGIEGGPAAATLARQKLDLVVEGDIEKITYPFADGTIDLVLTLDILEHLVDPWTTLEKLVKLMRPGGSIVVSIPNVRHYSVLLPLIFLGDWRYTQEGLLDSTHIRFFTRRTAQKFFERQGLKLEAWDHTGGKRGIGAALNMLSFGLFKEFFIFQNLYRFSKPDDIQAV